MPDARRKRCQSCGEHEREAGPISWRGLCDTCSRTHVRDNVSQLMDRKGPYYDHWARRSFMAARRLILEHSAGQP
jgi:hypothetical protein